MPTQKTDTTERAVGRRKQASARVRLALGKGKIMINDRELEDFFPILILRNKVLSPLQVVGKEKDFDVSIKVSGGGVHGQADAVRHGIARALVKWNEDFKSILKAQGFLTRDSRVKERKKYGRRKARRGRQWKKR